MPLPRPAALAVLLVPIALAATAIVPSAAQGTPRSIGECERLKNDLAYNQCLAMFGPAAKNVAGGYASADAASLPNLPMPPALAASPAAAMAEPLPQVEGAEPGRRWRGRRGRQMASFTAGGGYASRSYRRHRRRY